MATIDLNTEFLECLVTWGHRAQHTTVDYKSTALNRRRLEIVSRDDIGCTKKAALFIVAGNEFVRRFGDTDPEGRLAFSSIVSKTIHAICYGHAPDFNIIETMTRIAIEYDTKLRTDKGNQLLIKHGERMEDFVGFMVTRYSLDNRSNLTKFH